MRNTNFEERKILKIDIIVQNVNLKLKENKNSFNFH